VGPPFFFVEVEKRLGGHAMDESGPTGDVSTGQVDDLDQFNHWLDGAVGEPVNEEHFNMVQHGSGVFEGDAMFGFPNHSPMWPLENGGTFQKSDDVSVCPSPSVEPDAVPVFDLPTPGPQPSIGDAQWQLGVAANFSQFSQRPSSLLLPWETGVFADIFGNSTFLELPMNCLPEPDSGLMEHIIAAADSAEAGSAAPLDSCYDKAVRHVQDLDYFENKNRLRELACGQWLEMLSCCWYATGVVEQLARDMQLDSSGTAAFETLKASFGIKSPQTLLKRAGSLRRYFKWHAELRSDAHAIQVSPLPFAENDVWAFFHWLRNLRFENQRGFTNASAFLETVRFMKFTLDLREADTVLQSRRLLGFAAIERLQKGPTRQAAPLELEHLQRLHEVLEGAACLTDRLGAGVMLVCIYGRARWSDLRYIHHVVAEEGRNGFLTLYTAEHKTSAVGARREQYLPLVVPWMGVTHDEWVKTFMDVYKMAGLDLFKVPLGPLMPAPRMGGSFGARPLSTPEAAEWLRLLLRGTKDCDQFKAHSLKTTLLVWSAKAGLDKEVRAVLGHHASALQGSEVVYSRHLQTRALRKLNMLLHRVRIGLGLEEDPMAPNPYATPCARTPRPVAVGPQPVTPLPPVPVLDKPLDAVEEAVEAVNIAGDLESVKEEQISLEQVEAAASSISLFDLEIVDKGIVELDSSSGSESESSSSTSSSGEANVPQRDAHAFVEVVPEGLTYYKHRKSAIMHKVTAGQKVAACGAQMSANFQQLTQRLTVRWPKCLKCFPRDSNRIRNLSQLNGALDAALDKAKRKAA